MKMHSSDKNYIEESGNTQEQLKRDKERFEEIHSEIYGFLPQPDKYRHAWNMFLAGVNHARK